MGIFHTDFGANAVAPKFRRNGSVDPSRAMDGFVLVGGGGRGQVDHAPWAEKGKNIIIKIRK